MATGFVLFALQAFGEPVRSALRYERAALLAAEWWRLLTAHFVHLGWAHCALNVGGLALCAVLARGRPNARDWIEATVAIAIGVGLLLWFASPQVTDYVGFSGVMYGLFVWALAPQAWHGDRLALAVLALVLGRVAWHLVGQPSPATAELIGGRVIAQAHLYGVLSAAAPLAWQAHRARRLRRAVRDTG